MRVICCFWSLNWCMHLWVQPFTEGLENVVIWRGRVAVSLRRWADGNARQKHQAYYSCQQYRKLTRRFTRRKWAKNGIGLSPFGYPTSVVCTVHQSPSVVIFVGLMFSILNSFGWWRYWFVSKQLYSLQLMEELPYAGRLSQWPSSTRSCSPYCTFFGRPTITMYLKKWISKALDF